MGRAFSGGRALSGLKMGLSGLKTILYWLFLFELSLLVCEIGLTAVGAFWTEKGSEKGFLARKGLDEVDIPAVTEGGGVSEGGIIADEMEMKEMKYDSTDYMSERETTIYEQMQSFFQQGEQEHVSENPPHAARYFGEMTYDEMQAFIQRSINTYQQDNDDNKVDGFLSSSYHSIVDNLHRFRAMLKHRATNVAKNAGVPSKEEQMILGRSEEGDEGEDGFMAGMDYENGGHIVNYHVGMNAEEAADILLFITGIMLAILIFVMVYLFRLRIYRSLKRLGIRW